ncbi:MAG TPA: hypothetical protein VGR57_07630, partial [Ktedonobacterales bacterium]|nr:hypothetical protein [Ktedonobacterales bacterium]
HVLPVTPPPPDAALALTPGHHHSEATKPLLAKDEADTGQTGHKRTVTLRGGGSLTIKISTTNLWRLPPDAFQLVAAIRGAIEAYEDYERCTSHMENHGEERVP